MIDSREWLPHPLTGAVDVRLTTRQPPDARKSTRAYRRAMLRLLPLTLAAFLLPASAALAAEAPTAITVYKGARSVSVKSAPKGVIVLGSAKGGKAAVAIAR